jgi:hypothetical protein
MYPVAMHKRLTAKKRQFWPIQAHGCHAFLCGAQLKNNGFGRFSR